MKKTTRNAKAWLTTAAVAALAAIVIAGFIGINNQGGTNVQAASLNSLPRLGDSNVMALNSANEKIEGLVNGAPGQHYHTSKARIFVGLDENAAVMADQTVTDRMTTWLDNGEMTPFIIGQRVNWNFAGKAPVCPGTAPEHATHASDHWRGRHFGLTVTNNRLTGTLKLPPDWKNNPNYRKYKVVDGLTHTWRVRVGRHVSQNTYEEHPGKHKESCFYDTRYFLYVQYTAPTPPTPTPVTPRPPATEIPAPDSTSDCNTGRGSYGDPATYPNWVKPSNRGTGITNEKMNEPYKRYDWENRNDRNADDADGEITRGIFKYHHSGWHEHVKNEGCHNHGHIGQHTTH